MRGDLLFYRPRDLVGQVVARFTNGPYCHVAIDCGGDTKIEADITGVVQKPLGPRDYDRFSLHADPKRLADAFSWLQKQVGEHYGWEDIANQVLKFLHIPVYLGERRHYDCSDLVARFVRIADAFDLGEFTEDLHLITPNDLARLAGKESPLAPTHLSGTPAR